MAFHAVILSDGIMPFVLGGMQRHTSLFVKYLIEAGHRVSLFHSLPHGHKEPTQSEILEALQIANAHHDQLRIFTFHWPKLFGIPGHYIAENWVYSQKLFRRFSKEGLDPDLILAKGFTGLAFFQYSSNHKIPVLTHIHGYEMYQHDIDFKGFIRNRMLRVLSRIVLKRSTYLISYGGKITGLLKEQGVQAHRIFENPSGVLPSWLAEKDEIGVGETNKVVFLGRSERRKGIDEIKKAISTFHGDIEFHFIGPIEAFQIQGKKLVFHGVVKEESRLKNLLTQMDILLCPSYAEGMPNVIMEGMARGLAVISTDVGAVSLLVSSENGWMVEPGDVQSLVAVFHDISKLDSQLLVQKKKASRELIENFVWPRPIVLFEGELKRHQILA